MNGMRKLLLGSLGVVALVSLLTAGLASARQRDFLGHFTLTSETRWGRAVLPPGSYTFELDLTQDLLIIRGQHRVAMIKTLPHATDTRVKSSDLILMSRGGKAVVRALQLAQCKAVLVYAVPNETAKQIAQEPVLNERVPLTMNGN